MPCTPVATRRTAFIASVEVPPRAARSDSHFKKTISVALCMGPRFVNIELKALDQERASVGTLPE